MKKKIYLTGFMGAGKTTVGKELARVLQYRFVDLDDWISERAGLSIPDIFQYQGEAAFRMMETEALKDFAGDNSLIVATGGGIVENEDNIQYMKKSGIVIFLHADFSAIYERIKNDQSRPLTKEGMEGLATRYSKRLPLYRKAHHIIHTEEKEVNQVITEIQFLLSV
ncbi:MAG: shikimate kinase [Bacillus sp. (in: Bacteria)]|nr:shikimate kinase [Bacillus sp. (in: firmicutes)]